MGEVVVANGNLSAGAFVVPVRVYYEDTDAAGIVYHSNYLNFAERARTELLRTFGDDHAALRGRFGIAFVVSKCDMHCLSPARLDEMIEVRTSLNGVGGATIDLSPMLANKGVDLLILMQ